MDALSVTAVKSTAFTFCTKIKGGRNMEMQSTWLMEKIRQQKAVIGVIGLGYVGLPLAIAFAKAGFTVYGFDVDTEKIKTLKAGKSYVIDSKDEDVAAIVESGHFKPTADFSGIRLLDAVSICVPTPLNKSHEPDMSYIISAVNDIKKNMHTDFLITLESTTYPGTTEELIEKELAAEGYAVGEDYFLCFSPERIDPGNAVFHTGNTPKVLGGTTASCTEHGVFLYQQIVEQIVPVSCPKVAEMTKLLENTFRSINIAFINEMAMMSDKLGIDIWETIEAADTKPFGFMKFSPGPGIGGHCIPLDPMYLSWKARASNFYSKFIEIAQETNKGMPNYVISKVSEALNLRSRSIRGSRILILGMAYKPDIDDVRESPGLEIYELLKGYGAILDYNDPYARSFKDKNGDKVESVELDYAHIGAYDCILLLTKHSDYDYRIIGEKAKMIVDTRNAFEHQSNVVKLGAPTNNAEKNFIVKTAVIHRKGYFRTYQIRK